MAIIAAMLEKLKTLISTIVEFTKKNMVLLSCLLAAGIILIVMAIAASRTRETLRIEPMVMIRLTTDSVDAGQVLHDSSLADHLIER